MQSRFRRYLNVFQKIHYHGVSALTGEGAFIPPSPPPVLILQVLPTFVLICRSSCPSTSTWARKCPSPTSSWSVSSATCVLSFPLPSSHSFQPLPDEGSHPEAPRYFSCPTHVVRCAVWHGRSPSRRQGREVPHPDRHRPILRRGSAAEQPGPSHLHRTLLPPRR